MLRNDAINIYTDGSAFSKPRAGGMGVRLVLVYFDANETIEDYVLDGHVGATNNQMELRACARGLRLACEHPRSRDYQRRVVFSDLRYVVDNWRSAMDSWPNSGWRTRDGAPVLNVELWRELVGWIVRTGRRVDFVWVKGHAKDQHNRAVDKLAKESAKRVIGPLFNPPLGVVHVRRKAHQECGTARKRRDARPIAAGANHYVGVPESPEGIQVQVRSSIKRRVPPMVWWTSPSQRFRLERGITTRWN